MRITTDGIEFDTDAMTVTEGDVTLALAEDWLPPNVPESDDYSEAWTSGWQPEGGA